MQATAVLRADGRGGPARIAAPPRVDAAAGAPTESAALAARKAALRARCRAARRARPPAPGAGASIAAHALASIPVPSGCVVAGYWPFADEADPRPLMRELARRGHPLCLPAVAGRGQPLAFRAWMEGGALEPGPFGTSEPPAAAPTRVPAALLVPLLAADVRGFRLGYGGGYYDRTLAGLAGALAIGVAFHDQLRPAAPCGPHDRPLDWIATERGAWRCNGDRPS